MKPDDYYAVSEASHKEELRSALTEFASKMGFGLINTMIIDGPIDSPSLRIGAVGNTPAEFLASHNDLSDIRLDPVLRRLAGPTTPFAYDQAFYVKAGVGHLWELQAPHGYKNGLAASLPVGDNKYVFVGVDTPDRLSTDEVVITRMMADLQLLATHAHLAAVRLLDAPVPGLEALGLPTLTSRELEVLIWAAQGKSTTDTAVILGLSNSTVKGYVESVLRKFGVSSKIQAVKLATALGMID
ncbi:MAG: LuxR family transcriptional regulator [Nevskiaceae bacterium]|nr:MAG: LuxR family transcriptional regulator [Nevskiaceae bacterium]